MIVPEVGKFGLVTEKQYSNMIQRINDPISLTDSSQPAVYRNWCRDAASYSVRDGEFLIQTDSKKIVLYQDRWLQSVNDIIHLEMGRKQSKDSDIILNALKEKYLIGNYKNAPSIPWISAQIEIAIDIAVHCSM